MEKTKENNTYKIDIVMSVDDLAAILLSSKPIDGRGFWKWEETKNNFRDYIESVFSDIDKGLCNKAIDRFNQICSG